MHGLLEKARDKKVVRGFLCDVYWVTRNLVTRDTPLAQSALGHIVLVTLLL